MCERACVCVYTRVYVFVCMWNWKCIALFRCWWEFIVSVSRVPAMLKEVCVRHHLRINFHTRVWQNLACLKWDLRFSRWWPWQVFSSGMWFRVVWYNLSVVAEEPDDGGTVTRNMSNYIPHSRYHILDIGIYCLFCGVHVFAKAIRRCIPLIFGLGPC